ncbi:MAG: cadherin-like beta sandwich domain-containing protein, partial [Verrucomicrobiota bacterium]
NLPVTGLEHETTYYYRVMGSNSLGIAYGAALSFTTYSTNALLQYLAVNNGEAPLSPNFDPYVTNYTITVPTSAVSVTIDAIGHRDDFTNDLYTVVLQVTNVTVANPVPLAVSGATTITIVVTAQDGVTTCAYSVLVTRAASVPVTVTLAADPIGATNATLRASVNPNSLSAAAGAAFQYSTQPVFGSGAWIVVASGIYNSRYQYVVGGEDGGIAVDGSGTIYTTYNNRFEVIRVNSAGVATNLVQPFDYQSDPYTGNSYTDAYSMGGVAVNRDGTAIYTARSSVSKSTFKGIEKWQGSGVTWNYDRSRPTSIPPWYPVLDEATGDLYVTCKTYYSGTMQPGKLVRIDGTTKAATYLTLTYVGSPTPASINSPVWMVRDSAGALYFTDESTYNSGYTYTLRKATQNGSSWAVSTLATLPSEPKGLAMDSSGTIYVTYGGSAYSMSAPTWQPTQLVPGPNITGSKTLTDMTVDSNGNLYLVESSADPGRILKYSPGPAMLTAKLDGGADATGLTGTSDVAVNL